MKAIFIKLSLIAFLVSAFVACGDNMGDTDGRLTEVKTLIEPADGKSVVLDAGATSSAYFEWEFAEPGESGTAVYQIAFDKANGDFSKPVYMTASDNNGYSNYATVTHKLLNKIAGMMGIKSSETGTFKWTVFSSKGTKSMKAGKEYAIAITRLAGYDDLPLDVYLTGEGTEAGAELSKAIRMKAVAGGEFEVYTLLTAGSTFHFEESITGDARSFYTNDGIIRENGTSTVDKTGIYKIALDFNTGGCTYTEILKVALFLNWSQREIELPYKASGIWELTNYTITGLTGSDNSDDRYKFRMESSAGQSEWRAENNDSKPTGNPAYYYMVQRFDVKQWTDGQVWKSPSTTGWSDKTYDFMFSLSPNGTYTHHLTIK